MMILRSLGLFPLAIIVLTVAFVAAGAQAQTYTVLYNFGTHSGDPLNPDVPGLIAQGRDGNLYSTTDNGGTNGLGTVFKITPKGKLTVLYNFDGPHGQGPAGGLTLGTDGNFYGTTVYGGAHGDGTIFKITASGKLTVLYDFTGGSDGFQPYGPPIQGSDGSLYGTTGFGGALCGTVYKITASDSLTTLHSFIGSDGCLPFAALVQVSDGSIYGTTELGGPTGNDGEVFKITPSGVFKVISGFDGANGGNPYSSVIQGKDGNFYGTTLGWGGFGWGTIYKVTRNGSLMTLYDFNGNTDSGGPYAGLVEATDGNFYGAASGGGFSNGTIYSINNTGIFSVLHSFDGINGSAPTVTPMQHTTGIFFGDTTCGGSGVNGGCIVGNGGGGVMYSLDLGLAPFVSLLPNSGKIAKTVDFLGQGLTGTTKVSFAGRLAQFSVKSDTFLTATVPSGAVSGFVTITTPSGILKSNKPFLVLPQLLSFDPPSGPPGTQVTITGMSLTQTLGVGFGDRVSAQFTVNSDASVTATVPQGAKTGKIGIETKGGVAISQGTFEVTE